MELNFKTLADFHKFFKTEKKCYEFLEQHRWNGKAVCPHCGTDKEPYKVKARGKFLDIPSYRCSERACDLPFTVRTGSIFEGSRVEAKKWLHAIYELMTCRNGISSVELGVRIGVSQKTAWFMNHRIRSMFSEKFPEKLGGVVEVDETYIGGKEKNKHYNKRKSIPTETQFDRPPVVGFVARGGKLVLKAQRVQKLYGENIKPIVRANVDTSAILVTDGFGAYYGLDKEYRAHAVVNHAAGEYVRGAFHTNTIEGAFSILKTAIVGTFHYMSRKHLQRYCDEFAFRYNNKLSTNLQRFSESFKRLETAKVTYKRLTAPTF
jgi:hypothetical protein